LKTVSPTIRRKTNERSLLDFEQRGAVVFKAPNKSEGNGEHSLALELALQKTIEVWKGQISSVKKKRRNSCLSFFSFLLV